MRTGSNLGLKPIVNLDVLATGYLQGLPTVSSTTCAEQRVLWRPRLHVDRRLTVLHRIDGLPGTPL